MKNESYPQDIQFITQISNINSIFILKFIKKIHITNSYIKVLYHKSILKISNYKKYSILISIIKYIEISDLIFLIFIQSLSFVAVNALDFDFIKLIISKILNCYKNLFEIFFKKEFIHSFILSFNFSVLFIKKFNDNLRLYVDYRALNCMIIKNHYSISLIIEIMN